MRIGLLIFGVLLGVAAGGLELARAEEPATVDPFLQAAQWAEAAPASEAAEPEFADGDAVACGDEVGLAALVEPNARRRGGWSLLTELTVLMPSYSTTTLETANEHPILGPRISLGWESDQGFGIRGRGWGFDSAVDIAQPLEQSFYNAPLDITSHQINFSGNRFDLDFYKRVEHRTGYFAFGASLTAAELTLRERYTATQSSYYYNRPLYYGYPYYTGFTDDLYGPDGYDLEDPGRQPDQLIVGDLRGDYDDYAPLPTPPTPVLTNIQSSSTQYNNGIATTTYNGGAVIRNRGGGLGLLAEGSHRFYETPVHVWSVFGRGRVAYLIGQWEQPHSSGLTEGDANMVLSEAALGLEYRRKLRAADMFVQCAFEVQSWDVSQVGRVNFAGVTPSIGLNW
ncbi:MAG: hypothetical protein JNL18_20670 [Planctomycetaceae bacterium]|nr:hypothetical protein [Planctomycetaceae bacterium]